MREAKLNEILNSKQSIPILEARIQEASQNLSNKNLLKVASMDNSIYNFDQSNSEEVNIAAYV